MTASPSTHIDNYDALDGNACWSAWMDERRVSTVIEQSIRNGPLTGESTADWQQRLLARITTERASLASPQVAARVLPVVAYSSRRSVSGRAS